MDEVPAPYGDIVALHPAHCFIPTASAIALNGVGLFTPLIGHPSVPSGTPFNAVYLPAANEDHVQVTPGNAAFILGEIEAPVLSAPEELSARDANLRAWPQPSRGSMTVAFTLPSASRVRLSVLDIGGRLVDVLRECELAAGDHRVSWNRAPSSVAPGVYFVQLDAGRARRTVRTVVVQ
jgi:hypothetical protein